ncbi:MAG: HAD-IIIA family hydrolase [Nitrospirae bacterium]|nr:HAD-IIIA family hydrolase [Nitrospirota bacterium]
MEAKTKKIKLLILDVDGVMTDGSIILDNEGNELKRFHVRDGHGIRMLKKAGIRTAIITGRKSKVVKRRAKELGIADVFQGVYKKSLVYDSLREKYSLKDENIAFMGDDIVDIELFRRASVTAAPADAEEEVMKRADFISSRNGGRGAVREFTDLILKSSGRWGDVSGENLD